LGPKERREREREEIRTRILDAARELFANEGFEAVTMRRIADRIEYSPTAIYFHFRDKEALLKELCDNDFGALAHQFLDIATIPYTIERLRQTGYAYARFGIEHPNHYRLMFMTPHPPIDAADQELEKGNPEEDAYAFLKVIVGEAIRTGRFRQGLEDDDLIAQTIWAGMHGVVSLQIAKCNDDWIDWRPLEDRTRSMIDMIVDGLTR
jgi:AcrR family transcriptional regulator